VIDAARQHVDAEKLDLIGLAEGGWYTRASVSKCRRIGKESHERVAGLLQAGRIDRLAPLARETRRTIQ